MFSPRPVPCRREQRTSSWWGGAQTPKRLTSRSGGQPDSSRCMEGHNATGPQRVHLLGRGGQAGSHAGTPHTPDPGGARGGPTSAMLLARVRTPRTKRQIEVNKRSVVPDPRNESSGRRPQTRSTCFCRCVSLVSSRIRDPATDQLVVFVGSVCGYMSRPRRALETTRGSNG